MAHQFLVVAALSGIISLSSANFFMIPHGPTDNQRHPPTAGEAITGNESHLPATTPKPTFTGFRRCDQRSQSDLRADPEDCGKFSMCTSGILISFSCPPRTVFEVESKTCVPQGSFMDKCSRKTEEITEEICPVGSSYKKAHPKECAQFYHCGQPAREERWEKHLQECDYPMLYNLDSERCEHFSMVKCGLRREPIDPCDYKSNQCLSGHCVPCSVRHPSCRDKKDGMNAWAGRQGSPHYVVCAAQRVVYHGMCPQDKGTQIFDEATGTCTMLNARQEYLRHY